MTTTSRRRRRTDVDVSIKVVAHVDVDLDIDVADVDIDVDVRTQVGILDPQPDDCFHDGDDFVLLSRCSSHHTPLISYPIYNSP